MSRLIYVKNYLIVSSKVSSSMAVQSARRYGQLRFRDVSSGNRFHKVFTDRGLTNAFVIIVLTGIEPDTSVLKARLTDNPRSSKNALSLILNFKHEND